MTSAMTDNRTTEQRISKPLLGFIKHQRNRGYIDVGQTQWLFNIADEIDAKHEQAVAATLGSEREKTLGKSLNEVAEKWAIAQVEAEDCAKRCMLLEELVQDWQALYEEPDYGDCIRLRKRMQELGIEVIDE